MGHTKIEMTARYLHIVDSDKAAAIDSLGTIGYAEKYTTRGYTPEERKRMSENCKGGSRFKKKKQDAPTSNDEEIAV